VTFLWLHFVFGFSTKFHLLNISDPATPACIMHLQFIWKIFCQW
jgi:hypothetical protein